MKLTRRGGIFIESLAVSALIIVALTVIANYFKKNEEVYKDIYGNAVNIKEEVRKAKKEAPLIIVGKIARKYDKTNVWAQGEQHILGVLYFDVLIDSIEKGHYPDKDIKVFMGWFSDFNPPALFPPFLKKDYHKGERIRLFVYYNRKDGYYTPYLWYTIEPVV